MIHDKLLRERDINEILGTLGDKIKRCKTDEAIGLLEELEGDLLQELDQIQQWLNDY